MKLAEEVQTINDQAQNVIDDSVAQCVTTNVPDVNVIREELGSHYERKVSHDDQIVPGVCSCTEPEPESSESEEIGNEESGTSEIKTPEIRLQSEDNGFIDNERNLNEDTAYGEDNMCEEESDEDELTPSENLNRSAEMVVMSDPGVIRRGGDGEYSDDGEEIEIYTDEEVYSDEDYEDGEERGYRYSEEREGSSEYSEEVVRSSSEREVSPGVGSEQFVKDASPLNTCEGRTEEGTLEGGEEVKSQNVIPDPMILPESQGSTDGHIVTKDELEESEGVLMASNETQNDSEDEQYISEKSTEMVPTEALPQSTVSDDIEEKIMHEHDDDMLQHSCDPHLEDVHAEEAVMVQSVPSNDSSYSHGSMEAMDTHGGVETNDTLDTATNKDGNILDEGSDAVQEDLQDDVLNEPSPEPCVGEMLAIDSDPKVLQTDDRNMNNTDIQNDPLESEGICDAGEDAVVYKEDLCAVMHGDDNLTDVVNVASNEIESTTGVEFEKRDEDDGSDVSENDGLETDEIGGGNAVVGQSDLEVHDAPNFEGGEVVRTSHTEETDNITHIEEDFVEKQQQSFENLHPYPVIPQGVPPPITPDATGEENMFPGVINKTLGGEIHQVENESINGVVENGSTEEMVIEREDDKSESRPDEREREEDDRELSPGAINTEVEEREFNSETVQDRIDVLKRGDSLVIESEGSDMEERSITPDPDQVIQMQEKHIPCQTEMTIEQYQDSSEADTAARQEIRMPGSEQDDEVHDTPTQHGMTGSMHESFHEEGQCLDEHFVKNQDATIDAMDESLHHEKPQESESQNQGVMLGSMHESCHIEQEEENEPYEQDMMTGSMHEPRDGEQEQEHEPHDQDMMTGSMHESLPLEKDPEEHFVENQDLMTGGSMNESLQFEKDHGEQLVGSQDMMTGSMHESIHLDEGEGIEDMHVPMGSESGVMEGSFILEEGQTVEDLPQTAVTGSVMEGSLVMEQGQTIDDLQNGDDLEPSDEQETSEESPNIDIPAQMSRSAMEDSVVLDEGQTFEDQAIPDQMTGSLMESSIILDEGQTFDDQQYQDEESRSITESRSVEESRSIEDSATQEVQQTSYEMDAMTGSMILAQGEQLEDVSKSMMEGSMVLDEGEPFGNHLQQGQTTMSASFSESYSEPHLDDSLQEQVEHEIKKEEEVEVVESLQEENVYSAEESRCQREAAQNMVENVLNDAIDKVESSQDDTRQREKVEINHHDDTKTEKQEEAIQEIKIDTDKKQETVKSKTITESKKMKTKVEKEKKNESVVVKESKKTEKKITEVKKEKPKSAATPRTGGSDVFSRLYQDSSKRIERIRKTPEKGEADTKIPSPTKSADIPKRSVSATRQARRPQRSEDDRNLESPEKKESRSKSTPRPYTAPGSRRSDSTHRASRPTQLHRPKKG